MAVVASPVIEFVKPHLHKPHIEIEFRLGKKNKNGNYFDTNVGKENYEKLYRRLSKYPSWDSVTHTEHSLFYGTRPGLRVTFDEKIDEQVSCITKHNLGNFDQILKDQMFDVRVSASLENPATYDQEKDMFTHERKRKRTSFVRKGLSIDLSIVENSDKDSENQLVYQAELEIVEPASELNDVKLANHYQKVFDLMKLLV
jgi:hypothetical protein